MKILKLSFIFVIISLLLINCKIQNKNQSKVTLKDTFKENFVVGAALGKEHITGVDSVGIKLVEWQFSSITPENIMKWMYIHPETGVFNFDISDQYVEFGEKNNMFIVGHTLVWHNQLAKYVKEIQDSADLADHIKTHIHTIVDKYKGRINGWDVVNEALNEDGTLRESVFYNVLGDSYLKLAFEEAAKADPNAELYYNDYNMCLPLKRTGAIELVKNLQASNTKIDGIGMQGHWGLEKPALEEIEKSIVLFSELGVKVMITELDISVLPNPWDIIGADIEKNFENSEEMNPYTAELPDSVETKLTQRYEDIFNIFLKHEDKISRVTFWGVNDGHSWLNNWPVKGRTNYPLLFDREYKPKDAFYKIVELKMK